MVRISPQNSFQIFSQSPTYMTKVSHIYISGLLQPAGEVSPYDRFWQPWIQTQLVAESLLTPDWLFLYTYWVYHKCSHLDVLGWCMLMFLKVELAYIDAKPCVGRFFESKIINISICLCISSSMLFKITCMTPVCSPYIVSSQFTHVFHL